MMRNFDVDDLDDEPTNPAPRGASARVLVVEDDSALRHLIAARMRREGFEVLEARSGDEALVVLSFAARSPVPFDEIDLLVMDVRMPGASGLDVARALRATSSTLPVVLITAFPEREVIREAARLRLHLLAKPFGLDRLSDTAIDALLERRGRGSAA